MHGVKAMYMKVKSNALNKGKKHVVVLAPQIYYFDICLPQENVYLCYFKMPDRCAALGCSLNSFYNNDLQYTKVYIEKS